MSRTERIPLLADHHSHPSVYGALRSCPDLRGVSDKQEALRRLADSPDEVIFALGWSDTAYSLDAADLEPLPPSVVCNTSLHSFRLNQAARERFEPTYPEIMASIEDPEWVELNLPAILAFLAEARGCDAGRLVRFYDGLFDLGIWSAQEMALPGQWFVETVEQAGLTDRTRFWVDPAIYQGLDEATREKVAGIKLFTDGALGARTAAMREPLLSGERGILLRSDEAFREALGAAAETGKSVAMHAVGDRALDQLLDTVEFARASGLEFPEVRAEHCQFLTAETAARVRDLGITLSMQPNFSSETIDYADRLSSELCQRNNPFRMLIDDFGFVPGVDLILGSDGMPHGATFALQMSLFPPLASQRLTLEEFVEGYCMPDFSNGHIDIKLDDDARTVAITATQAAGTDS